MHPITIYLLQQARDTGRFGTQRRAESILSALSDLSRMNLNESDRGAIYALERPIEDFIDILTMTESIHAAIAKAESSVDPSGTGAAADTSEECRRPTGTGSTDPAEAP